MWELDHKKTESWRTDAFELWCWRKLLGVPWTARRSNQSIRKEICPENSLEGLMLKLKLQYFGHLMGRTDSLEKTLMLGKIEGRRRRGWDGWMASLTWWTWVWVSSGCWWWTGRPGVLQSMGLQRVKTWLSDWTELNWYPNLLHYLPFDVEPRLWCVCPVWTFVLSFLHKHCSQGIIWNFPCRVLWKRAD